MFSTPLLCGAARKAPVDLHVANYELWMAVQEGRPSVVEEMCGIGAEVNSQQPTSGLTAVMMACIYGHDDILEILLEGERQRLRQNGARRGKLQVELRR
eukprot:scaffold754_cov248-Pinguiococcus_pyrenoidosus.AAC.26